ncbi:MAG: serine hydrolase domain-containing protein [bacterium]
MDLSIIEKKIHNAINNTYCPGMVVLISLNFEVVYHQAFGYLDSSHQEKATIETVYDLASLTKQLATTTAIMILYDKGMINLSDRVSKYLTEIRDAEKRHITISHLLSNSAGFVSYKPYYTSLLDIEQKEGKPLIGHHEAKRYYYDFLCNEKLEYEPGSKSIYSDLGFMLVGFIIEKISSMELDEFCDKFIFTPLGLKKTFFNDLSQGEQSISILRKNHHTFAPTENCPWRKKVLCGQVHDDNAYAMGGVAGHAGLFSTASDIHKLLRALCMPYSLDQPHNFLPTHVIKKFFARQDIPGSTWCLGWDTPSPKGSSSGHLFSKDSIGHTGFTGTSIWIDLKRNLWVILLSNRIHPSRQNFKFNSLRPELHDAILRWAIEIMRL